MLAGYTMGLESSGRELLIVVIKGTFMLPRRGEQVLLHDDQLPLVMADTFSGAPGLSAPVHEVDFAARKRACDVLLLGSAYAPSGRTATRVEVGLRVGPIIKTCDVVGDRAWSASVASIRSTSPQPFERKLISYDVAFGGVDQESEDPSEHDAYLLNPIGRGFRRRLKASLVDGRPLPNTEVPGRPVTSPADKYEPMAFGPVGRGWQQRACFAGTYDQHWLDHDFPFLPKDFDERYFQAAPADQQMPFANAPIEVTLKNLTSDGMRHFVLPHFEAPVHVFPKKSAREEYAAVLDTIVLEPDADRFTMTWRVTRPLKKNAFEIGQVMVGKKSAAWWRARDTGKTYYPSLAELAASRAGIGKRPPDA